MKTIDARRDVEDDNYEMMGICGNCVSHFTLLFSTGEKTRPMHTCPNCKVLAKFTLSKKADGMKWVQAPEGLLFCCPRCLTYGSKPVGMVFGEHLIFCDKCQEEINEDSGPQD